MRICLIFMHVNPIVGLWPSNDYEDGDRAMASTTTRRTKSWLPKAAARKPVKAAIEKPRSARTVGLRPAQQPRHVGWAIDALFDRRGQLALPTWADNREPTLAGAGGSFAGNCDGFCPSIE